jgi:septal ring factor EnvC (AmiA/AmiB activator)
VLNRVARLAGVALLLSGMAVPAPAGQDDRARTEALAARAAARMDALHREADQLAAEERTLLGDLRKLEVERQLKLEELRQLDAQAGALEGDLKTITGRFAALEAEEVAARPELEARLVEMYKMGQARYARLLLATSDFRRLGQAARTAAALAKLDRDRLAAHQKTFEELTATRSALESRQRTLETLRAEARRANAEVVRAAQARSAAIAQIDRERDLNAQLVGELQGAQQKLQATLRALGGTADATRVTLPLKTFRGEIPWPAAGPVRRRFTRATGGGEPASSGIEIASVEGTPVAAVHDGSVAFAGAFAGYGNLVIVDHGAQAFSLYGNLLEISAKKGDFVEAGRPIGTVGASVAGPAGLYFELRVDGQPVDPLQWLRKN